MAALLRVPGCNPNMSPAETSVGKHSQGGCSRKSHCVLVQANCSQVSGVRAAVSGGNVNITNTATWPWARGAETGRTISRKSLDLYCVFLSLVALPP